MRADAASVWSVARHFPAQTTGSKQVRRKERVRLFHVKQFAVDEKEKGRPSHNIDLMEKVK